MIIKVLTFMLFKAVTELGLWAKHTISLRFVIILFHDSPVDWFGLTWILKSSNRFIWVLVTPLEILKVKR